MLSGPQVIDTRDAEVAFTAGVAVVKGTADRQVKLPAAANEPAIGIAGLDGDPAGTGRDAQKNSPPVILFGPADATAGAANAVGDFVKIGGADGRLIPIGGEGAGAVVEVVGKVIGKPAAADGDTCHILVNPYHATA